MAETKCLTDGRRGRPWSNLNLKTRRTESRRSPLEVLQGHRVGRPRGTTTPHFICGDLDLKPRAHKEGRVDKFPQVGNLLPTTLRSCIEASPSSARAEMEGLPRAALGTEDATHPKRGLAEARPPARAAGSCPSPRGGPGARRKTVLKRPTRRGRRVLASVDGL